MQPHRSVFSLFFLPLVLILSGCEPMPARPGSGAAPPTVFAEIVPAGTGVVRLDGAVIGSRQRFSSGSGVQTGRAASALISFSDGARVQFDEETDPAQVSWSGNTLTVRLDDGVADVVTGSVLSISEIITSLADLFTRSEVIVEEEKRSFMRADLFSGTMRLTRPVTGPLQESGQYVLVRPSGDRPVAFGRTPPEKARALRQRFDRWDFSTAPQVRPIETYRMPNLVGSSADLARQELAEMGLAVSQIADVTQGRAVGASVVIEQTPAPGTIVRPGAFISLTVRARTAALTVPDVTGSRLGNAVRRLQSDGFRFRVEGSNDEQAVVARQVPPGGQQASPGTTVRLTTRAPDPQQTIVPSLTRLGIEQAISRLNGAGLRLGQISGPQSGLRTVVRQFPGAGARVPVGSAVNITVVSSVEQNPAGTVAPQIPGGLILRPIPVEVLIPVPRVERMPVIEALRLLQSTGFSTELRGESGPGAVVVAQRPSGGTQAKTGSVVVVFGATPQQIQ